jgi:hypothetical protein
MTGPIIAIAMGVCLLFLAWQQRGRIGSGGRFGNSGSGAIKPQQPHLERKLIKLLSGNRNTAERIIRQSQLRYPDKPADWHWEKAIYDLERDRWR